MRIVSVGHMNSLFDWLSFATPSHKSKARSEHEVVFILTLLYITQWQSPRDICAIFAPAKMSTRDQCVAHGQWIDTTSTRAAAVYSGAYCNRGRQHKNAMAPAVTTAAVITSEEGDIFCRPRSHSMSRCFMYSASSESRSCLLGSTAATISNSTSARILESSLHTGVSTKGA